MAIQKPIAENEGQQKVNGVTAGEKIVSIQKR